MVFSTHLEKICGKRVVKFNSGERLEPTQWAYKIGEASGDAMPIANQLASLLSDSRSEELTALVVGAWSGAMEGKDSSELVDALAAAAHQLPNLEGLFLGDLTTAECELSWINQCDVSPLWEAYPNLREFGIRGGGQLKLGELKHGAIRSLTIECGISRALLNELTLATLPALESLNIFLGANSHGWDGSFSDFEPLITGNLFPELKHLALLDSDFGDEVAKALAVSPLLDQLEALDLSIGTLGDEGAKALLASSGVKKLKYLGLCYNNCTSEVVAALKRLPCDVNVSNQYDER